MHEKLHLPSVKNKIVETLGTGAAMANLRELHPTTHNGSAMHQVDQ
jgi:hypothetical protein